MSDLMDDLVLSILLHSTSFSNTLTFSGRHFVPSAVPQTLYMLCTLLVSTHLVVTCTGVVCLLPGVSWQAGFPSERGEEALLSLYTEISNFLARGIVALVLLHCLPTEIDTSDYCVLSEI